MTERKALDPTTTAVLVVDVQKLWTELAGSFMDPPVADVLPRIARLVDAGRAAGATTILIRQIMTADEHTPNTMQWYDFIRSNMLPGCPAAEFDPCIVPQPGDLEIIKKRYSAFVGTSLDELLRERGITSVVVLGLTTNMCVHSTVRDAWQRDYETITLADCCTELTDVGEHAHEWSLAWTARNFGEVCTSDEVIERWAAAREQAQTTPQAQLEGTR